jgi:hypothetical protein
MARDYRDGEDGTDSGEAEPSPGLIMAIAVDSGFYSKPCTALCKNAGSLKGALAGGRHTFQPHIAEGMAAEKC